MKALLTISILIICFQNSMGQVTSELQALSEGRSQLRLLSNNGFGAFDLRVNNDGILRFIANFFDEVMRIDNFTGNVGIGTDSPDEPLSFKNSIGPKINLFDGNGIYGFGMASAELQIGTFDNTKHISLGHFSGANKTFVEWMFLDGGNRPLTMASGAHVSSGGVWTNASSRSFKENITDLSVDEAVSALIDLNPVKFNYIIQKGEEYLGFIAEDVPDLIATHDKKSLSPMDIVAVLTRVVQKQQSEISDLKAQTSEVNDIKREMAELKSLYNAHIKSSSKK